MDELMNEYIRFTRRMRMAYEELYGGKGLLTVCCENIKQDRTMMGKHGCPEKMSLSKAAREYRRAYQCGFQALEAIGWFDREHAMLRSADYVIAASVLQNLSARGLMKETERMLECLNLGDETPDVKLCMYVFPKGIHHEDVTRVLIDRRNRKGSDET